MERIDPNTITSLSVLRKKYDILFDEYIKARQTITELEKLVELLPKNFNNMKFEVGEEVTIDGKFAVVTGREQTTKQSKDGELTVNNSYNVKFEGGMSAYKHESYLNKTKEIISDDEYDYLLKASYINHNLDNLNDETKSNIVDYLNKGDGWIK